MHYGTTMDHVSYVSKNLKPNWEVPSFLQLLHNKLIPRKRVLPEKI
jgi:hypothetical protein